MIPRSLALAVMSALLCASPAAAADATCETLQATLEAAETGSTVRLTDTSLCGGAYFLPPRAITLAGVDGAGFQPSGPGEGRSLNGFDVGSTVIRNLVFRGAGDAESHPGGLYIDGSGAPQLEGLTFVGLEQFGDGGGAYIRQAGNLDRRGSRALGDPISIRNSVFGTLVEGNRSIEGDGGGLFVSSEGPVELDENSFAGNSATRGAGARVRAKSALLTGNSFIGNIAGQIGGGLHLSVAAANDLISPARAPGDDTSADADLARSTFIGNHAGNGSFGAAGGFLVEKAGDFLEENSFAGGAAILVDSRDNHVAGNAVVDGQFLRTGGGGMFLGASLVSSRDRFATNRVDAATAEQASQGKGGGLAFLAVPGRTGLLSATNLAVAGNQVGGAGEGGGVLVGDVPACEGGCHSPATFRYSTIASNAVGPSGAGPGIAGGDGDDLIVLRSILYGNTIQNAPPPEGPDSVEISGFGGGARVVSGSLACVGGNLAHPGGPERPGDPRESNRCADPLLVAPANGDVHLTPESPAIDQLYSEGEDDLDHDFDGDPRPLRAAADRPGYPFDIGADELVPAKADLSVAITDSPDPAVAGDTLTYAITVTNGGPAHAEGVTVVLTPGGGLVVHSAQSGQGSCTAGETIVCQIGTLDGPPKTTRAAASTIVVTGIAAAAGTASLTATVNSFTGDPDEADRTFTATTTITARRVPPATPPATTPPANDLLPAARECVSRRSFRIRIRRKRARTIVSATVRVNGKLVRTLRGRRLTAPVRLTGLPRGRFTVTITARTSTGKVIRGTRRYRTCTPKRISGRVPPL